LLNISSPTAKLTNGSLRCWPKAAADSKHLEGAGGPEESIGECAVRGALLVAAVATREVPGSGLQEKGRK
jgi:hypothetical protein